MKTKGKILDEIASNIYMPSGDKLFAPKTFARESALNAMQEYCDRIKDDICKENWYIKWYTKVSYEHLWPEVCRRYAEEVTRNEYALALAKVT